MCSFCKSVMTTSQGSKPTAAKNRAASFSGDKSGSHLSPVSDYDRIRNLSWQYVIKF